MTGESRSMEQNVLERSGLMKDFLSEKINGLKGERLKEIREKFESNVGNVRKQFESVLGAITSEAEQEIIVISYLRASYITETHEFYVGVYKGEPFVEEIKHGFISVKPLLGNVEKDFVELDQADVEANGSGTGKRVFPFDCSRERGDSPLVYGTIVPGVWYGTEIQRKEYLFWRIYG